MERANNNSRNVARAICFGGKPRSRLLIRIRPQVSRSALMTNSDAERPWLNRTLAAVPRSTGSGRPDGFRHTATNYIGGQSHYVERGKCDRLHPFRALPRCREAALPVYDPTGRQTGQDACGREIGAHPLKPSPVC
ncbi:hypothetical protein MSTO_12740 [Mycobacterium stomatepiae]|uniref:Uncharacterized protein n=1 Tax=Mycobacterium stomatepiae TaxID=470076 RepID=A0A7I7Q492_9MYCO|nr:hypothetical protein MSTO_12740 [Mycobacterium stomatepiae]